MKRLHPFEFEDLSWFPKKFRDILTSNMSYSMNIYGVYKSTIPLLKKVIDKTGKNYFVDLCSGDSGPWKMLLGKLDAKVTLTDKYPSASCKEFDYHPISVDATDNLTPLSPTIVSKPCGNNSIILSSCANLIAFNTSFLDAFGFEKAMLL